MKFDRLLRELEVFREGVVVVVLSREVCELVEAFMNCWSLELLLLLEFSLPRKNGKGKTGILVFLLGSDFNLFFVSSY